MQRNVEGWERLASVATGAWMFGASRRGRTARLPMRVLGAALMARGFSGMCPVNAALGRGRRRDDTRKALGGARGIRVRERVIVGESVETLWAFWRDLSNLPNVMSHLDRVDVADGQSHWVARGPGGFAVQWDATIINEIPNALLAWKSLPGSDVASAGSVRFRRLAADLTEIEVTLQYDPPTGKIGASLAWLAGQAPAKLLREDLRRLKERIETGVVHPRPTAGPAEWLVIVS